MILIKTSNYVGKKYAEDELYIRNADKDLSSLFVALQGRLRFGNSSDGANGENIAGQWQTIGDTGSADTEFSVPHSLGSIPVGYIVTSISAAGIVYTSGTAWTTTTAYFKTNAANAGVTIFLLK